MIYGGKCFGACRRNAFGGWAQRKYGGERKRRRSYAEVAEGIPKLLENALKQCLCGLQGINGWEGAWGLVVGDTGFAALAGFCVVVCGAKLLPELSLCQGYQLAG